MKPRLLLITLSVLGLAVYAQGQQTTQTANRLPVKVSFSVIDAAGQAVNDLKPEDIEVFDEGTPVNVQALSQLTSPVFYGLLIDHSGSLKLHFSNLIDVANQLIAANEANDQTFLISFVHHEKIEMVQEVTSDKAALIAGVNALRIEGGQTALIDAIYLGAQYAMKHRPSTDCRVALVLLSDGDERASYYREQQLMELLRPSKIQVFVVAFVGDLKDEGGFIRQSPRQKATDLATRLAHETRGDAFILRSPKELAAAATSLRLELHNQYVLEYSPARKVDKVDRNVEIKLTKSPQHEKWRLIVGNVTTEAQK